MLKCIIAVLCIAIAVVILLPSDFEAVGRTLPTAPLREGILAENGLLRSAEVLSRRFVGAEAFTWDAQGRMYTGLVDGRIMRMDANNVEATAEQFARTLGRPLGLRFDAGGNLIVADAFIGLLSIDPEGVVTILSVEAEGVPFKFADYLDIADDGSIYFSDASHTYGLHQLTEDAMSGLNNGRLLRYDPKTKTTEVVMRDLAFANGVTLSEDQQSVYVSETWAARVQRVWVSGPKKGQIQVVTDNLPCLPDNMDMHKGILWIGCASKRLPDMEFVMKHPIAAKLLVKLGIRAKPKDYGLIVGIDAETGQVRHSLDDPTGETVSVVTCATVHKGHIYMGSYVNAFIARVPLPQP